LNGNIPIPPISPLSLLFGKVGRKVLKDAPGCGFDVWIQKTLNEEEVAERGLKSCRNLGCARSSIRPINIRFYFTFCFIKNQFETKRKKKLYYCILLKNKYL
jgi:hypothetical protein